MAATDADEREALIRLGAQAAKDRDARNVAQVVTATVDAILATRSAPIVSEERVAELRSRIAALVNPTDDPNPAWDIAVASIVHEVLAVMHPKKGDKE